jgi:hypothetical protein
MLPGRHEAGDLVATPYLTRNALSAGPIPAPVRSSAGDGSGGAGQRLRVTPAVGSTPRRLDSS